MDDIIILGAGVGVWIGCWKLANIASPKMTKRQQVMVFGSMIVISIIVILVIQKKKLDRAKENGEEVESDLDIAKLDRTKILK